MSRRRWRITLLGALATLAAVYPVTSLFQSSAWLSPAIVMIAVSAGTGLLMRGLTRSRLLVVAVQLVVTAYVILAQFAGDTFFLLLPTISTLQAANSYGLEALDTLGRYSAPAPLGDGVTFYLVIIVTLIAISVDAMAATWRSPAAAGLPLLTAYLVTAANGDSALAVRFFVIPAALWLVMLHTTARAQFGRWSTTSATDDQARTVLPHDGAAMRSFSVGAAKLGLAGLVLALIVPVVVPHFPPRYLTDGLGRSSSEGGGGGGSVGFNNTVDLTRSLNNDDDSPVLQYTTTGLSRSPLRVLATGYYSRGEWLAVKDDTAGGGQPQPLPPPKDRTDYEITVSDNTLAAPNIAAPYPVVAVAMDGTPWTIDPVTRDVRVSRPVSNYRITYADVAPLPSVLRESGKPDSPDVVDDDLAIPDTSRDLLDSWSKKVTAGKNNPLDRAIAIQDSLRSAEYQYTLQLGEPLRDDAGRIVDPITTFYKTKRGYCVQFATAMIMLARAQGIPARMAIGFLPGTSTDGKYVVRASDAHAWPELYFQGYGWLRFEPTPGARSGTPPPYAVEGASDGAAGAGRAPSESKTGKAGSQAPLPSAKASQAPVAAAPSFTDSLGSVFSLRNIVTALTLLVLLLAIFVMPITAFLDRARRRRQAVTRQDLVEVEWNDLTSHLRDLGLPAPPGDTLRQTRDRFIHDGHLGVDNAEAVRRVTMTLEKARYDRPERTSVEEADALHHDIRQIRREVGRTRASSTRLRSFLWPEAGVSIWRDLPGRVSDLFRRNNR
ncbi:MAG: DUF3488 and transglutaminase-like domain-containing protein [Terracoccus sp.]